MPWGRGRWWTRGRAWWTWPWRTARPSQGRASSTSSPPWPTTPCISSACCLTAVRCPPPPASFAPAALPRPAPAHGSSAMNRIFCERGNFGSVSAADVPTAIATPSQMPGVRAFVCAGGGGGGGGKVCLLATVFARVIFLGIPLPGDRHTWPWAMQCSLVPAHMSACFDLKHRIVKLLAEMKSLSVPSNLSARRGRHVQHCSIGF